jgi:hypothetical protein
VRGHVLAMPCGTGQHPPRKARNSVGTRRPSASRSAFVGSCHPSLGLPRVSAESDRGRLIFSGPVNLWRKSLASTFFSIQAGCTSKPLSDSAASACSSFSSRATQSVTCFGLEMSCPSPERKVGHAAKLVCPTCDCGPHQQLVDPLDARVGSLHPRDERSSHLEFGWSRRMAPIVAPLRGVAGPRITRNSACGLYIRTIRSTPVRGLRKGSPFFGLILKASMVGFTLLSRSYYYLR